jgi:hypothetical protein
MPAPDGCPKCGRPAEPIPAEDPLPAPLKMVRTCNYIKFVAVYSARDTNLTHLLLHPSIVDFDNWCGNGQDSENQAQN